MKKVFHKDLALADPDVKRLIALGRVTWFDTRWMDDVDGKEVAPVLKRPMYPGEMTLVEDQNKGLFLRCSIHPDWTEEVPE